METKVKDRSHQEVDMITLDTCDTSPVGAHDGSRNLSQLEFDKLYGKEDQPERTFRGLVRKQCNKTQSWGKRCCIKWLLRTFPVIEMIRTYQPRSFLLGDILSGIGVGIMTVPQAMGYALLASVPPIAGLYTTFFSILVYFVFGMANHISMGVMAISSLITASVVAEETGVLQSAIATAGGNMTELTRQLHHDQLAIASSLAIVAGFVLVVCSILRLGFVTTFMGDSFMAGMLAGCNMHVNLSQLKYVLGINVPPITGTFKYFRLWIEIFKHIKETNIATLIISVISAAFLIVCKKFINEKYKRKLPVPIPFEIILVIATIVISHFAKLNERFGVEVIGNVPQGLPMPVVPTSIGHVQNYMLEACMMGIMSYIIMVVMIKLMAKRNKYQVEMNQEMFALGLTNVVSGFFQGFGTGVSPPRAFMMESTGGKTQFSHIVSALLVMLTLFLVAPLLKSLPICVLAILILVSCIPLFHQYAKSAYYFKRNKIDFSIWLVSFCSIVVIDVVKGTPVGLIYSLLTLIARGRSPKAIFMKPVKDFSAYVPTGLYMGVVDVPGMMILRFAAPLNFATVDNFQQLVSKFVRNMSNTCKPSHVISEGKHCCRQKTTNVALDKETGHVDPVPGLEEHVASEMNNEKEGLTDKVKEAGRASGAVHTLIIDCSAVSYIDTAGASAMAAVTEELKGRNITLAFAACSEELQQQLARLSECRNLLQDNLFPTVNHAIMRHRTTQASKAVLPKQSTEV